MRRQRHWQDRGRDPLLPHQLRPMQRGSLPMRWARRWCASWKGRH